jgi:serine/threonine-protein kinase
MGTVHLGRVVGASGFARIVAVKRPHPHLVREEELAKLLFDEANVASKIRDVHVVPTLDVVAEDGELLLVMEYVHGVSLSDLTKAARARGERIPTAIVSSIVCDLLRGLEAAHSARGEDGELLEIVHRDVSPQNVLIGVDGVARVVDFGIARARCRSTATAEGTIRGKLAYMAPEQVRRHPVSARTDVYAAGVLLWEALSGRRLFDADDDAAVLDQVLIGFVKPPSCHNRELPPEVDDLVLCALSSSPADRFGSAAEMATALAAALPPASRDDVAAWVRDACGAQLDRRAEQVASIERSPRLAKPRSHLPRRVIALVAATLAVLAMATVGATLLTRRAFAESGASAPPSAPATASVVVLADPTPLASPPTTGRDQGRSDGEGTRVVPRAAARPPTAPTQAKQRCALRSVDANGITRYHPECLN